MSTATIARPEQLTAAFRADSSTEARKEAARWLEDEPAVQSFQVVSDRPAEGALAQHYLVVVEVVFR